MVCLIQMESFSDFWDLCARYAVEDRGDGGIGAAAARRCGAGYGDWRCETRPRNATSIVEEQAECAGKHTADNKNHIKREVRLDEKLRSLPPHEVCFTSFQVVILSVMHGLPRYQISQSAGPSLPHLIGESEWPHDAQQIEYFCPFLPT